MQENALSTRDLFNACTVIFGNGVNISSDFLKYLQLAGLKTAYRKRALETHPDRAATLAEPELRLEERFKEVNLAYEKLSNFLEYPYRYSLLKYTPSWNIRPHKNTETRRPYANKAPRSRGNNGYKNWRGLNEHFWQGSLPRKKLLLGRFLYYSGAISIKTLIDAIVWQKKQRPAIGKIAVQLDWLALDDICSILKKRRPGEKFGECAMRCGYISSYQLTLLLGRQSMLQPRIGRFFLEKNILSTREMDLFIEKLRKHNSRTGQK